MLKTVILAAGLMLGGAALAPQAATAAPAPSASEAQVPTAWAQYGYYPRHRHYGHRHYGHRPYGYRRFGPPYGRAYGFRRHHHGFYGRPYRPGYYRF